ncbi:MAG: FHA domain-containing protein [Oscillospiraceae bacterium]|nr:FHA domain-containing protein [Oscillospiraceae bacterium]
MSLTITQSGGNQYLVYEVPGASINVDNDTLQMINGNQNRKISIAQIIPDGMNGIVEKLLFDITGKMPLLNYLHQPMSQTSFRQLILTLADAIEKFDNYMISVENTLLDPEYVYFNVIDQEVSFICIPTSEPVNFSNHDIYTFFRTISIEAMSSVQANSGEVSYFNLFTNALASSAAFSLENLKMALNPSAKKESVQPQPVEEQKADSAQANQQAVQYAAEVTVQVTANQKSAPGSDSIVAMPESSDKKSGGLLSMLKGSGLFRKGEKEPAPEKQKEKKPKKQKLDIGGLSNLSNMMTKKEPIPTEPVKQEVPQTEPVKNQTIFVTGQESQADAQPTPQEVSQSEQRKAMAQEMLYNDAPLKVDVNAGMQQNLGGTGVLSGGMVTKQPEAEAPAEKAPAAEQREPAPAEEDKGRRTILMEDEGRKTVLIVKYKLIRLKTQEEYPLTDAVVRVGRDRADLGIALQDNLHVGRDHAELRGTQDGYVLVDKKSSNHTYLNGQMLEPYKEYYLKNGDQIVFADDKFEYQILV